jgi:hypothetical protein
MENQATVKLKAFTIIKLPLSQDLLAAVVLRQNEDLDLDGIRDEGNKKGEIFNRISLNFLISTF